MWNCVSHRAGSCFGVTPTQTNSCWRFGPFLKVQCETEMHCSYHRYILTLNLAEKRLSLICGASTFIPGRCLFWTKPTLEKEGSSNFMSVLESMQDGIPSKLPWVLSQLVNLPDQWCSGNLERRDVYPTLWLRSSARDGAWLMVFVQTINSPVRC